MPHAIAAASTAIYMENEMQKVRMASPHAQPDEDSVDEEGLDEVLPEVVSDPGAEIMYCGELSAQDVSNLSRSNKVKYTKAMNELTAVCGVGNYTFQSKRAVRCNICAKANPHLANTAKRTGGNEHPEAIIRLYSDFDIKKVTFAGPANKSRQIGHYHTAHGLGKSPRSKKASKANAKGAASVTKSAAIMHGVFRPVKPTAPWSLPGIALILQYIETCKIANNDAGLAKGEQQLREWEVSNLALLWT